MSFTIPNNDEINAWAKEGDEIKAELTEMRKKLIADAEKEDARSELGPENCAIVAKAFEDMANHMQQELIAVASYLRHGGGS